jgi:hypothetical protein
VRWSGPKIFLIAFVVLCGAGAIWSAATPLLGAPDEPSQIVKAVSVADGVWSARCYVTGAHGPPSVQCTANTVDAKGFEGVPTFYDMVESPEPRGPQQAHSQICFTSKSQIRGSIPASCARSLNRKPDAYDRSLASNLYAPSYQARYPPLYYFVVGMPSHIGQSTIDLYLMRLASAAFSAIFLALALTTALVYSRNRMLIAGLVVAATPMVFFLAGVINPSGLEIACGIAVWTAGAILVTERLAAPPKGLVAIFGLSAVFLESVRSLSPFWLALTVIALLACAERCGLVNALRTRAVQMCAAVVVLFGIVAVWWIVALHSTDLYLGTTNHAVPASVSTSTILKTALEHNRYFLPGMIGVFGWFDTYSPPFTFIVWYALVGVLILGAVIRSPRRVVPFAVLIAVVVVPALIVTSHAHTDGYTWSGRDAMPFAVGLPILSTALLGTGRSRPLRTVVLARWVPGLIVLAAMAQFAAFYEALRRYAVGTEGPIFGFITHPDWQPAISVKGALLLELAALTALSALWIRAVKMPVSRAAGATGASPILGSEDNDGSASSVSVADSTEGA